ncbi:MAG: amino acid adenylation domain-containing protein [Bacteroidetes bacterium]|nr:amino acid adenylation domain-containing protein [Bacteroidota bacterium]
MQQLLETLTGLRISLRTSGTELDIYDPEHALTEELLENIRTNKEELLQLLNAVAVNNNYKPVPLAGKKEQYVLSAAQRRMYFLSIMYPNTITYNMPQALKVAGRIEYDRLEYALNQLLKRHESLRTFFVMLNDEPYQVIAEKAVLIPEVCQSDSDLQTRNLVQQFVRPFVMSEAPLIRVALIEQTDGKTVLALDMHHIISDGVSGEVLVQDFTALYEGKELRPMQVQYKDYAEWQQSEPELARKEAQKDFWLKEFSGDLTSLELPLDYPRPTALDEHGGNHYFLLNEEVTAGLRNIAASQGASMFMVMLSVYTILLSKLSNQHDIVVGTVTAGRNHPDLEGIIGMFVNTLVLRNRPEGGKAFSEYLEEVKGTVLRAMQNQEYQYEDLLDALQVPRDTGRNALFDALISYHRDTEEEQDLPGMKVEPYSVETGAAKFDMTLNVFEGNKTIELCIDYRTCLFRKETIERFGRYIQHIAETIAVDNQCLLMDIDVMDEEEKNELLDFYGIAPVSYPKDKTLITLFEEQVTRTPDAIAVKMGDQQISYQSLNEQAEKIGIQLQQQGVKPNTIVALMMPKTPDIVTGMLGILKAGGAYLPIDVDYPKERKEYMFGNSATKHLLTLPGLADELQFTGVVMLFNQILEAEQHQAQLLQSGTKPADLCYVIYTSGTTGNPKGVMVEHRNVVRLLFNSGFQYDFNHTDVWTMFHSHCFDFSVWEMYGAILYGGRLIIIPRETARDTGKFLELLQEEQVTVLNQTPSAFYNLSQEALLHPNTALALRYIIFAGEALAPGKLYHWWKRYPAVKLINMYGITETTVHSTYKEIGEQEISTNVSNIGKPIPTLSIYILDTYKKLVPAGTPGEIYVGGDGVARGYLNNASLTRLKFIPNPYNPRERIYRSGDLARILPSGDMEYLGRMDEQVKIRGFRIELSEIDHHLNQHSQIRDAAVAVKGKDAEKFLVAYYVADENLEPAALKKYLLELLPDYMVPSFFTRIEKIPLTYNGKLDKKALPDPDLFTGYETAVPETATEKQLAAIWSEILRIPEEKIGVNRSFFELGGHSLRAVTLRNRISKHFGIEITVQQIFQQQDIKNQARLIAAAHQSSFLPVPRAAEKKYYVLSSAQRRMYFLDAISPGSTTYNVPIILRLRGALAYPLLERAFNKIIQRHESLRTSFVIINDAPCQVIAPKAELKIEQFHSQREDETNRIVQEFIRPFELSEGPLIRMGVVYTAPDDHILMADMHHIISDGIAAESFMKELIAFYTANDPADNQLQYKDYAEWQQSAAEQSRIEKQKAYWLAEFNEEVTPLQWPADHARPQVRTDEGMMHSFALEDELVQGLKKIAADQGASLFMVMLAVYNIFLSKITNQQDVVVGTPTSGREHPDLEGMIGMFVNTLPLRNQLEGTQSFPAFLRAVKTKFLSALQHQEYQYEDLVEALQLTRDTSRNPLFDTMISYHHSEESTPQLPGVEISYFPFASFISKFDLSFDVSESADSLQLNFEYSTVLFEQETIGAFSRYITNIIRYIIRQPETSIGSIRFMDETEEKFYTDTLTATAYNHGVPLSLPELFQQAAAQHKQKVALIFGNETMTYDSLAARSGQWANYLLQDYSVQPEQRIGICASRSIALITALLGIIQSGSAYVFIDPEYPEERINWMIKDSSIRLLITDRSPENFAASGVPCIEINKEPETKYNTPETKPVREDQLAYIIYTSGTTGTPKGVMIEQGSVTDYVLTFRKYFAVTPMDRVIHQSSLSFDTYVEELFPALISGASVIIVPQGARDIDDLLAQIEQKQATLLSTTPLILNEINKYPARVRNLRVIISGGEQLKSSHISALGMIPVYNTYGPAESTVCASFYQLRHTSDILSIGKPFANRKLYILNKDKQPVPAGTTGEIAIGGKGLARGYLNNESIQAEKFITNPFQPGERLYLSGDLGSWDKEGNVLFRGRKDDQFKIRGVRIEPGEIEAQLMQFGHIRSAVADMYTQAGTDYLLAYYVSEKDEDVNSIRTFLAARLPHYMIPAAFIRMDEIPYNAHGKLDKKALPVPELHATENYEGPGNETELHLSRIWADVLGMPQHEISVNSDFFELGGHSLNATALSNRINQLFNKNILSLNDIFWYPTIRLLSETIRRSEADMWKTGLRLTSLHRTPGEKNNIFFIHDGGGDIQAYRHLAEKLHGYNIWGIRSETLNYIEPLNIGIAELAALYLKQLQQLQPAGPYTLAGWSTGGTIVFEMARQLERAGESIAKVLMIDTEIILPAKGAVSRQPEKFNPEEERRVLSTLTGVSAETGGAATVKDIWKEAMTAIQRQRISSDIIASKLPPELLQLLPHYERLDSRTLVRTFNTVRTLINASDNYQFTGKITSPLLYIAAATSPITPDTVAAISENPVQFIRLSGDHFSLLNNHETPFIAAQLSTGIEVAG